MNWNALKSLKCPNCGHKLEAQYIHGVADRRGETHKHWFCRGTKCGFSINNKKLEEIVGEQHNKKNKQNRFDPDENLSDLNNWGRDQVREDFSDSGALDY